MPTIGVATTGSIPAAMLVVDMRDLFILDNDVAPFTGLLHKMNRTRVVYNNEYSHPNAEPLPPSTTVGVGGYAAGSPGATTTGVPVADASIFNIGDRAWNLRTGEQMWVTARDTGANTLSLRRQAGTTANAAGLANDVLHRLGPAHEENGLSPVPNLPIENSIENYCQIFKRSIGISGSAQKVKNYVGDPYEFRLRQANHELRKEMEMSFLFGERYKITGNQPVRFTRGVVPHLVTNVYDHANDTIDQDEFDQIVMPMARRSGSGQKVAFCGENWLRCFDRWGRTISRVEPSDDLIGFSASRYTAKGIDLMLVEHKLLRGALGDRLIILDMANIRRCPLNGRDLQLLPNRQESGRDGKVSELLAEVGVECQGEKTHVYVKGVTGPTIE